MASPTARPHRIDAIGEAVGRLEREIGGRHAKLAAKLLTRRDDALDEIVAPEPTRRRFDVAALQRPADGGRGNNFAFVALAGLDLVDDFDPEAEPRAGLAQEFRRAAARFAEVKIPADDHRPDAEPGDENGLDEFRGRLLRQRGVETQRHDARKA